MMRDKPIQLFTATFPDGIVYNVILLEDGTYSSYIAPHDILSSHETLEEAVDFVLDWSEEILKGAGVKWR